MIFNLRLGYRLSLKKPKVLKIFVVTAIFICIFNVFSIIFAV